MFVRRLLILATAALSTPFSYASEDHRGSAKVSIVFDHLLPNVPGKSMTGALVEYGPGGSSSAPIQPKSAFIFATVLNGSIKSQVNDGPVKIFHAGKNLSELPGGRNGVSANASNIEPSSLLAVLVVDSDEVTRVTEIKR